MQPTENFLKGYQLKAYFVMAFCLLIFFIRFLSNALLSQLAGPTFFFEQPEWVYGLLYESGIGQFIIKSYIITGVFDGMLFFLPLVFLLTLNRIFAFSFTVLALLYFMLFNIIAGHHYHSLVGLVVISIPFWSNREERFNFLWQGARYYLLYIFASAALWKIARGSAFSPHQLSNILMAQHVDFLYQHPDALRAKIAAYLITHPAISFGLLLANVLVQLSFAIGFFTKKFDTILFYLALLFVVANYFVMGIVSSELLILTLTLWNWDKVETITQKLRARYSSDPVTA